MNKFRTLFFLFLFFGTNELYSQIVYTFNGNGNWSDSANWVNKLVPPTTLNYGTKIVLNPTSSGQCIINIPVHIPPHVDLSIPAGKRLNILGGLNINYDSTVVLKDNVHVIDSSKFVLTSTSSMLANGVYEYMLYVTPGSFAIGDVLVGNVRNGYIRKVQSITPGTSKITFQTTAGNMEDVFKQGHFNFDIKPDSASKLRPTEFTGINYVLEGKDLYHEGGIKLHLTKAEINLDPNWVFDFDFQNSKLKSFYLGFKNATFNTTFGVKIDASTTAPIVSGTDTLSRIPFKPFIRNILVYGIPVPIVVVINLDLICQYGVFVDAAATQEITFKSLSTLSAGISYENGKWNSTFIPYDSAGIEAISNGVLGAGVNVSIIPTFSFSLYNVAGPHVGLGIKSEIKAEYNPLPKDWNFYAGMWNYGTLGAQASIFGSSILNYGVDWNKDTTSYQAPYLIQSISGDNQRDNSVSALVEPIRVRVLDNLNFPIKNALVHFTNKADNGILGSNDVFTNADGYAETSWKLSSKYAVQTVQATLKTASGTQLKNSPITFKGYLADSTFVDPKDQQIYPYHKIGDQIWMTRNYNYNAPGSLCDSCEAFGRLYDWNTGNSIAPQGWHLPSHNEWITLTDLLGGVTTCAPKLKDSIIWKTNPANRGTNESGFSALPGGRALYSSKYSEGYWWTSTKIFDTSAWYRNLGYASVYVYSNWTRMNEKFSLRFVKDELTQIQTKPITSITQASAICSGIITNGETIISRGICWDTIGSPTVANNKILSGKGFGTFSVELNNLLATPTYYVRAFAITDRDTSYGNEYSFNTLPDSSFTDSRDGQVYTFRHIGSQVWMTKNLNFQIANSWCYDNSGANCDIYGKLYLWSAANLAIPSGWHLPTRQEFGTLETFLGNSLAGRKMMSKDLWINPTVYINNASGFNGLPSGNRYGGIYYSIGQQTYFWTSSGQGSPYAVSLNKTASYLSGGSLSGSWAVSVRCIRD